MEASLSTQDNPVSVEGSLEHQCILCDKKFAYSQNLNRHIRRVHKSNIVQPKTPMKCCLCSAECASYKSMMAHLVSQHALQIDNEVVHFTSMEDFLRWKKRIEAETSSFFRKRGASKCGPGECTYFTCNRSGRYSPRGKGLRKLKRQGSGKINAECPARMKMVKTDEDITVTFTKTHVGHDCDLRYTYPYICRKPTLEERKSELREQTSSILDYIGSCTDDKQCQLINDLLSHVTDVLKTSMGEKNE